MSKRVIVHLTGQELCLTRGSLKKLTAHHHHRLNVERYVKALEIKRLFLPQEAIEDVDDNETLDLEQRSKLHLLSGGTKVVQHSSPPKISSGLKGTTRISTVEYC